MGLDMYIFKVKKTKKDLSSIKTVDDIGKLGLAYLEEKVVDANMYQDLLPYCTPVKCEFEHVDMKKICQVYGLKNVFGYSIFEGNIGLSDSNGKRIEITNKEIDEEFTIKSVRTAYVFEEDEVHYWRKRYDIQDYVYDLYPIENCGYYEVEIEALENIQAEYDSELQIPDLNEDEAFFYHEWY